MFWSSIFIVSSFMIFVADVLPKETTALTIIGSVMLSVGLLIQLVIQTKYDEDQKKYENQIEQLNKQLDIIRKELASITREEQ